MRIYFKCADMQDFRCADCYNASDVQISNYRCADALDVQISNFRCADYFKFC